MVRFCPPIHVWLLIAAALAANPAICHAAVVSLVRQSRPITIAEFVAGAPAGGVVHDFFITTQSDLLSISGITIDAPLYQHQWGSNHRPSATALVDQDASVGVNSFIQMPGDTLVLGGGFNGGAGSLWGDLSDDGAQQDFLFARLTTTEAGLFAGNLAVRTDFGFESLPFQFQLPALGDVAPLNNADSLQIEYTPLPPPRAPEPPTPVIEAPSTHPAVPKIDVVEILPPAVEPPSIPPSFPTEPPEAAKPPVDEPPADHSSEGIVNIVVYPFPLVFDNLWINWPGRADSDTSLLELLGDIEPISLDGFLDAELLVNIAGGNATFVELSSMLNSQVELHMFSVGSMDAPVLRNSTYDSARRSAHVPEPASAALGAAAITAAIGFRRQTGKNWSKNAELAITSSWHDRRRGVSLTRFNVSSR